MTIHISQFRGKYRFLSNFYPAPVFYDEQHWPTAEHAYQGAKSFNLDDRRAIFNASSPGIAKRLGQRVNVRPDWEHIKLDVMRDILRIKFEKYSALGTALDETADAELMEGNNWGDQFWGTDLRGKGLNHLGGILMQIREENRG